MNVIKKIKSQIADATDRPVLAAATLVVIAGTIVVATASLINTINETAEQIKNS